MYCPNCGSRNAETSSYCFSCGDALSRGSSASTIASPPPPPPTATSASASAATRPENHLVKAILVTLFCCLPFGIASIVQASRVDGAFERGDHAEAVRLADKANDYANVSIGIGLVIGFLYFLIGVASGF